MELEKDGLIFEIKSREAYVSGIADSSLRNISIPEEVGGFQVTGILQAAFYAKKDLESIHIPASVRTIEHSSFLMCSGLKDITIDEGMLETIPENCFAYCDNVDSVHIPASLKYLSKSAFMGTFVDGVYIKDMAAWCEMYKSNIDATPTTSSNHFYLNDVEVKDLVIPNGVTRIENCSFTGAKGITSVSIPASVKTIKPCAFEYCKNIANIKFAHNSELESIGALAFGRLSEIETITLPKKLKSIADMAFYFCSNLKSVTIGPEVTEIIDDAFAASNPIITCTMGSYVDNFCQKHNLREIYVDNAYKSELQHLLDATRDDDCR